MFYGRSIIILPGQQTEAASMQAAPSALTLSGVMCRLAYEEEEHIHVCRDSNSNNTVCTVSSFPLLLKRRVR